MLAYLLLVSLAVGSWAGCLDEQSQGTHLLGSFTPACDSQGNYKSRQCSGSTGLCWCVDTQTGAQVSSKVRDASLDCDNVTCATERAFAQKQTLLGASIPTCDGNGDYTPAQCSGSTGYCWCVDVKTGAKVAGTEVRGTPKCGMTECQRTYETARNSSLVGAFVPSCDSNGDYSPMQCHGSTGYCWCVATKTGEKIVGSETRGTAKCDTVCRKQVEDMPAKPLIGGFVPTCNNDTGLFLPIQCSGSTGYCWCVDETSGEEVEGTALRGTPDCSTSTCTKQRSQALQSGLIGAFIPKCDTNGNFARIQCNDGGYCYCVDPKTGDKVLGSDVRFKQPTCA